MLTVFEFLFANDHLFLIPLGAPKFLVRIAKYQGQSQDENARLIRKISKWLEAHSAEKTDTEKIRKITTRYLRIFRIFKFIVKIPLLRIILGIVIVNLLQLKIYENHELQNENTKITMEGLQKFLVRTHGKIAKYLADAMSTSKEDNGQ